MTKKVLGRAASPAIGRFETAYSLLRVPTIKRSMSGRIALLASGPPAAMVINLHSEGRSFLKSASSFWRALMTDQKPIASPWRTDFENAPSPCIGWCTPPAGDDVRKIWRHPHLKGAWSAHSVTQTVKAWQPMPLIDGTLAAVGGTRE